MTQTLLQIVDELDRQNRDWTIYAVEPWTCDSLALVALAPDEGGVASSAARMGAAYFIEVFIAREFLEDWIETLTAPTSTRALCQRLIEYAIYDA